MKKFFLKKIVGEKMAVFFQVETGKTVHVVEQPGGKFSIFEAGADTDPTAMLVNVASQTILPTEIQAKVRQGLLKEVSAYDTAQVDGLEFLAGRLEEKGIGSVNVNI